MTDATTLKPCPFCGGEAKTNGGGNSEYGRFWWRVWCRECGCAMHDRERWLPHGGNLDPAYPAGECLARWNTRADLPPTLSVDAYDEFWAETEREGVQFMTEKNDGGPAFLIASDVLGHNEGMTLRAWFAGKALVACGESNPNLPGDPADHIKWPGAYELAERRAAWAVIQADAMIAALKGQPE